MVGVRSDTTDTMIAANYQMANIHSSQEAALLGMSNFHYPGGSRSTIYYDGHTKQDTATTERSFMGGLSLNDDGYNDD